MESHGKRVEPFSDDTGWLGISGIARKLRWEPEDEDPTRAGRELDLPRAARAYDLRHQNGRQADTMLQCHAAKHGYVLDIFYNNIEGEAINRVYRAVDEGFDGLVMNPAGSHLRWLCAEGLH